MTDIALQQPRRPGIGWLVLAIAALWGGLVTLGSLSGFLGRFPTELVAPAAAWLLGGVLLAYFRVAAFQQWVAAFGLRRLSALHIWRIGATAIFFYYGAHALLPEQFVFNAGWGDLIAGLLAIVAISLPFSLKTYWTFHTIGFADFVLAVGTGMFFAVTGGPGIENLASFPLALIPLFGVPISGATHIMAFHMMRKGIAR